MDTLVFFDYETVESLTTLDFASVAPSSSDDTALVVHNNSETYQAVDVIVSLSGTDADQLWLSLDDDTFGTELSVGTIPPGGGSKPVYLRRVTASTDTGSCTAVVKASPASWSAPVDTSTSIDIGLDQDIELDYDPSVDEV